MRRFVLVAVLTAAVTASAASAGMVTFKTPSRNIVCLYVSGGGQKPAIECGIKSGLKPAPSRHGPGCGHVDYVGNRVDLGATGRAKPVSCAGDAGPFAYQSRARVLQYGRTWHAGGIWCSAHPSGLVCTNPQSHGFFLSRDRWKAF